MQYRRINPYKTSPNYKFWDRIRLQLHILNEAQHIFNKNNIEYEHTIKNAYIDALLHYNKKENLILLYKNEKNLLFTKHTFKITIYNDIITVNLYICKNSSLASQEGDAYNISSTDIDTSEYTSDVLPLFKSHKENRDQLLNKDHTKFVFLPIDIIDEVSIIMQLPDDAFNYMHIDTYTGIIQHEFIHILHQYKNNMLNYNAGDAYYITNDLCEIAEMNFPTVDELEKLFAKCFLNLDEHILFIAACIYYLDTSEYSAFLDTYKTENRRAIKDNSLYTNTYRIYYYLNNYLNHYINYYIQHGYTNILTYNFLLRYIKHRFPNKSFKDIITYWKKRSSSWLKKAKQINAELHPE